MEELLASNALDLHTTYFETVTAMALLLFAESEVEWVVLEVGLGGRLDATNVVTPELCVITAIDFDHEAYLGRSLEAIAGEKAGILKAGVPAVLSRQRPEAGAVLDQRVAQLSLSVARTDAWSIDQIEATARGSRFTLDGERQLHIVCPLAGEHQIENAATAAVALTRLGVSDTEIEAGIAQAQWLGRLERVSENPDIILDGAHNPAGERAHAAYNQRYYADRKVNLIFGAMRDKALDDNSGSVFPHAGEVIVSAQLQARAMWPVVFGVISDHPTRALPPISEAALAMLAECPPADAIFITGSLFLVAEARRMLVQ